MMKCVKCKSEIEPHALFCIYCGHEVSQTDTVINPSPDQNTEKKWYESERRKESSETISNHTMPIRMITITFVIIFAVIIGTWLIGRLHPNSWVAQNGHKTDVRRDSGAVTNQSEAAVELTVAQVNGYLQTWVDCQNARDFASYSKYYSSDFRGIKRTGDGKSSTFDRQSWLEDRSKMFYNTTGLHIRIEDPKVTLIPESGSASVVFMQYFSTKRYSDKGEKRLLIKVVPSGLEIASEEMLWSSKN